MSEDFKIVTCPLCGNPRANSHHHVVVEIGMCNLADGGCGNVWSLEDGLSFDLQPPLVDSQGPTRRSFLIGALAAPLSVASVGKAAFAGPCLTKSIELASIFNMNSYQMWTWHFALEQAADGSFTLISEQVHDIPDDEIPPWEVEPRTGLCSGGDIFNALHAEIDHVNEGGTMTMEAIESAERALTEVDPRLAEEFRKEASEYDFQDWRV